MPRYFLKTTAEPTLPDTVGEQLPDDAAACAGAIASLAELLPGQTTELISGGAFGVTVAREDGSVFYRIDAIATTGETEQ